MAWYPLGPGHVHLPRNPSYARISRQNEYARQGTVVSIAFQPSDRDRMLAVDRPDTGGRGLWLTTDGAATWSPVLDAVHATAGAAYGPGVDPTCVVFHPNVAGYVYFGTGRKRSLFRSTDAGVTWTFVHEFAGAIRSITVNPRTAPDLGSVAATQLFVVVAEPGASSSVNGVWFSGTEGGSWTQVLAGDVESFAPRFPPAPAVSDAYAYVRFTGLHRSSDPGVASSYALVATGPALAPGASGPLPGASAGHYDRVRLARSPVDADRVWAWTAFGNTEAIYRRGAGGTWTRVATSGFVPNPWQGTRNFVFAAAPLMPPGATVEPLFFGSVGLYRSIDGGVTWQEADPSHSDLHAIAFRAPALAGALPELWVGSDGGVACSTGYLGTAAIPSTPNRNDGATIDDASPAIRPMNRGKSGSAAYQLAVPAGARTLAYLGCQDTGIAVGGGSATWRSVTDADAGSLAAAAGPAGMRLWAIGGFNLSIPWPPFDMRLIVDNGVSASGSSVTRAGTGSLVPTTSNYVLHGSDACLAGAISRDDVRHLTAAVDASPDLPAWITLNSVSGIQLGQWVTINPTVETMETARVLAIDAPGTRIQIHRTFRHYDPPMAVALNDSIVIRADGAGVAMAISPSVAAGAHVVRALALQPGTAAVALAATRRTWYHGGTLDPHSDDPGLVLPPDPEFDRPRVYKTTGGVAAVTAWTLVDGNRPTAAGRVSSVAVAASGQGFALLQEPIAGTAASGTTVTTPLFRLDGMNWIALPPAALPTGFPFGKVLVDPVDDGRLYVSCGAHVYLVSAGAGGAWTWSAISMGSDGLPGDVITDMWIGNVGTAALPTVLLRVATGARGVWETDVTPATVALGDRLYMRDNMLDDGWISPSPAGIPNPLRPAENVWWWQSPDIRVETSQIGPAGNFYQTQPEWTGGRLPHAMFNMVRDFSLNLEQNRAAKIHVQVHNRSRMPAAARVVVLATRSAAGVPDLDRRSDGTTFPFWSRFHADGTVDLGDWPANSVWIPVEMTAESVSGIHAGEPRIVSRTWTVPPLSEGDHRCLIAIVHSASNPAGSITSSTHVDAITRLHRGLAQKNLHIVPMQLANMGQRPDVEGARATSDARRTGRQMWMSAPFEIDFWAPEERLSDLVFDLRGAGGVSLRIELAAETRQGRAPIVARSGKTLVVRGVRIAEGRPLTARVTVRGDDTLKDGDERRFDIVQRSKRDAVGGSSYIVRVGKPLRREDEKPESPEPERATRITRLAPLILAPPWLEDEVVSRLRERGRMPGS
jgi:hypothetical protein